MPRKNRTEDEIEYADSTDAFLVAFDDQEVSEDELFRRFAIPAIPNEFISNI